MSDKTRKNSPRTAPNEERPLCLTKEDRDRLRACIGKVLMTIGESLPCLRCEGHQID